MTQKDLFNDTSRSGDEHSNCEEIQLEGCTLTRYPTLLPDADSWALFYKLTTEINWQQPNILISGKPIAIPRKQYWLGDSPYAYTYSGTKFSAKPWHPEILKLKQAIERTTAHQFNSALCNYYKDGRDSVAWHADNEPELGQSPIIASYSLGETREFQLRREQDHSVKYKLALNHNELLLMGEGTQALWQHQIPKSTKPLKPRINITFRKIIEPF